ncbi:unnamed protein product [Enterobius vermicularis]|uniref:Uncharacterized protein n=1 Tax=Enterobius vermicularis TaxID=51028 RepID=A0A0N4VJK2_ENTVE|nr:unnamed protein product [Enterobius vermicularis]
MSSSSPSSTTTPLPSKYDSKKETDSTAAPVVRMRTKTPLSQTQTQVVPNGTPNGTSLAVLQRGLEALNEVSPEIDDNIEGKFFLFGHRIFYIIAVAENIKIVG